MARNSRSGRKIDFTRWEGIQESALALSAGTLAVTLIAAASDPQTILRTRLEVLGYMDGLLGPGALVAIGMGLIIMPQGQGAIVVSSPLSDPNAPWFWYTAFTIGHEELVTDVIDNSGLSVYRGTVDSKAMRIQRSDREVQLVFELVTIGNAGAVNLSVTGRMLIGK